MKRSFFVLDCPIEHAQHQGCLIEHAQHQGCVLDHATETVLASTKTFVLASALSAVHRWRHVVDILEMTAQFIVPVLARIKGSTADRAEQQMRLCRNWCYRWRHNTDDEVEAKKVIEAFLWDLRVRHILIGCYEG